MTNSRIVSLLGLFVSMHTSTGGLDGNILYGWFFQILIWVDLGEVGCAVILLQNQD